MALYLPSLREDVVLPTGLAIERVADAETLHAWAEVWAGQVMVGQQGIARGGCSARWGWSRSARCRAI